MPPRWLRRLLIAPLALLAALTVLVALPVLVVIAVVISPLVPGRWRPLRLLLVAIVYAALEAIGLISAFALWVISGFGLWIQRPWFVEAHYRLLGFLLKALIATARYALNLRIDPEIEEIEQSATSPWLVLCRHAGPGDSFLLVHNLLVEEDRRPRIVLKETLQWDPMIDTILNRLPARFVSPGRGGERVIASIGALAQEMGPRDALVIFPEGGNFTEPRRLRSIAKLEELGEHELAERARAMRNLIAPRPGGTLAAIESAPEDTVVVLVAHTGLEDLSTAVDLWRGLPIDSAIRSRSWDIPISDLPAGHDDRVDWLYERFAEIDAWIEENRG